MPGPSPLLIDLGRTIREVRTERQISQDELGLRTGIHRNYIGGIERGERNPSVTSIAQLAEALDITLAELFAATEGN
jgi:transcriptional regulator with XRE-family HTH domain